MTDPRPEHGDRKVSFSEMYRTKFCRTFLVTGWKEWAALSRKQVNFTYSCLCHSDQLVIHSTIKILSFSLIYSFVYNMCIYACIRPPELDYHVA